MAPDRVRSGAPKLRPDAGQERAPWLHRGGKLQAFSAQMHEDDVDGHAMKPGGERRFSAEGGDLAMQLEECFPGSGLPLLPRCRPCANTASIHAACWQRTSLRRRDGLPPGRGRLYRLATLVWKHQRQDPLGGVLPLWTLWSELRRLSERSSESILSLEI